MPVSSSDRRTRTPVVSGATHAALLVLTVACVAKVENDGGVRSHEETTHTSADRPTAGMALDSSAAETSASSVSTASVAPTTIAATPHPEGELQSCTSVTWSDPSEQKREAACTQQWDEVNQQPVAGYVCSCDVKQCPLYVYENRESDVPPLARLNECVIDAVASGCDDSLQAACGMPRGQHGFCEREYYGLTPTRPNQTPPVSATVVCFEQLDGTHACLCPNEPELVTTDEPDCNRALLTACQTPCESEAGDCTSNDAGYDCACTAGFTRLVETGLCDYALFYACEPACSNEMGACYWDPAGGSTITCRCNDDDEPQVIDLDPNVEGDECRTPLVATCGGSSEGPHAWP